VDTANNERLLRRFHEQIAFLGRSCAAFDQGYEEESFRIATSLRIIFHQKGRNISLITHLKLGNRKILSSSRGFGNWQDYLAHELNINSSEPIRMRPLLGSSFKDISITDWWDAETVFIHNEKKYSRRMIILSAADKDGGAHVDAELEKYYEVLCMGEYAMGITSI
jgi:hypothetical protein